MLLEISSGDDALAAGVADPVLAGAAIERHPASAPVVAASHTARRATAFRALAFRSIPPRVTNPIYNDEPTSRTRGSRCARPRRRLLREQRQRILPGLRGTAKRGVRGRHQSPLRLDLNLDLDGAHAGREGGAR